MAFKKLHLKEQPHSNIFLKLFGIKLMANLWHKTIIYSYSLNMLRIEAITFNNFMNCRNSYYLLLCLTT